MAEESFDAVTGEIAEPFDAEVAPSWRIDGLGTLDWALAKLALIEREMEQNNQLALAAHQRVDAWLTKQNAKLGQSAAFFRGHITTYANEHKAELLTGKKKSRELPNGKVAWRKVGGGLKVVDEALLLSWATNRLLDPMLFRKKYAPDLDALEKYMEGNYGPQPTELPAGVERVPEEDRLTITATGTELTKKEE